MESKTNRIIKRLLTFVTAIFIAVILSGCNDPIVADMEEEHRRLGLIVQQDLRQNQSGFPPSVQAKMSYQAP